MSSTAHTEAMYTALVAHLCKWFKIKNTQCGLVLGKLVISFELKGLQIVLRSNKKVHAIVPVYNKNQLSNVVYTFCREQEKLYPH